MATSKIIFIAFLLVLPLISGLPISEEGSDEQGDFFQGDIDLSPEQEAIINDTSRGSRTGLLSLASRWPKNSAGQVIVPVNFQAASGFTNSEKSTIISGLRELEAKTCVRFVQRTSQADYVEIYSGSGCSSSLGRRGGRQMLSLKRNGCVTFGIAMHEFIHALGYTHMQNHIDRDRFVKVNFQNIMIEARGNFNRVDSRSYGNYGTSYDYLSIMHYGRKFFNSNGGDTLVPTDTRYLNYIGNRDYLTSGDVARINNMYRC